MICWHFDGLRWFVSNRTALPIQFFFLSVARMSHRHTAKEESCMNLTPKTICELFICRHTAFPLSLQLKANMYACVFVYEEMFMCRIQKKVSCTQRTVKCCAHSGYWDYDGPTLTVIKYDLTFWKTHRVVQFGSVQRTYEYEREARAEEEEVWNNTCLACLVYPACGANTYARA